MFYKLKKDTFVRNYDDIGYITSTGIFNDRVVNGSGAVLLSVLRENLNLWNNWWKKVLLYFPMFQSTG